MQLKNSYFYFKSAISPEQCKKIIDLGKSQIEEDKKRGIATHGTTGGNKEKQSLNDNAVPLNDKTYSELENVSKPELISHKILRNFCVCSQKSYDLLNA